MCVSRNVRIALLSLKRSRENKKGYVEKTKTITSAIHPGSTRVE